MTGPEHTAPVFALVGPSGVGKDSLLAEVAPRVPGLHVVQRVITRAPEAGGEPCLAVTQEEFAQMLEAGDFALHWGAHDLRYGIRWSELAPRVAGCPVVFNGSRGALEQAAQLLPELEVLHVTACPDVLAARLAARGRESNAQIEARLARAALPLPPELQQALKVHEIDNSGPLEIAAARLEALLQPVRA
ncbi:phosphonate metabolism protein/1,5-bisphosphokinase (PRPP-forming) PhnN [Alloyangia pacifica]|uniref:phosphonate metabolism protein/1,5-bisphosphokinase (PRPP-forming) PhnN n=1 Tax=Alloyangia pacifica TaxID=311180 RepID=UPI001CD41DEE|nr:phosphonate metabolism protein/1,5-bisphosphokinase (PRPP-forming) PhnN [Alloyangia pacifica]MCA0995568.1 phosphonate metabolism protein/1,5-bisphosphokinase (PRPP-forming) PhnN [Alloyangia pacifica]